MRFLQSFKKGRTGLLFQAQASFQALSGPQVQKSSLLGQVFGPNATLSAFLNAAFKTAIMIGAILAVIRIVYAGVLYMGSDVYGNKKRARDILQDAVIGLLLLLATYTILYQINHDLVKINVVDILTPAK